MICCQPTFPQRGPACAGSSIAWRKVGKVFHSMEESAQNLPHCSPTFEGSSTVWKTIPDRSSPLSQTGGVERRSLMVDGEKRIGQTELHPILYPRTSDLDFLPLGLRNPEP